MVFTITMDDAAGTVIVKEVPVPEKAFRISLEENELYQCMVTAGNEPQIYLTVYTTEEDYYMDRYIQVLLSEDMIIDGEIDFTEAGEYPITVFYNGATVEEIVTVYDPANPVITYVGFNNNYIALLVKEGEVVYDLEGYYLMVQYDNGNCEEVPLTEDMLRKSDIALEAGLEEWQLVCVSYRDVPVDQDFYVALIDTSAQATDVNVRTNDFVVIPVGGTLSIGYIEYFVEVNQGGCSLYLPITADMLIDTETEAAPTLDVVGEYRCRIEHAFGGQEATGEVTISVVDLQADGVEAYAQVSGPYPITDTATELPEIIVDIMYSNGYAERITLVPAMFAELPDCTVPGELRLQFTYNNRSFDVSTSLYDPDAIEVEDVEAENDELLRVEEGIPFIRLEVRYNDGSYTYVRLTREMIVGTVDFTTIGEKEFEITYAGGTWEVWLEIYDPEICNVSSADLDGSTWITVSQGADKAALVESLIGMTGWVYYYEPVNGDYSDYFTVTEEMIDATALDTATVGEYRILITYMGYELEIVVNVQPDFSTATLLYTLQGNLVGESATVELYDNGYARVYGDPAPYTFDATTGKLVLDMGDYNGKYFYKVTLDTQDNTIGTFALDPATLALTQNAGVEAYTFELYSMPGVVYLIDESTAVVYFGGNPFAVCGYTREGNTANAMGMDWELDPENNTATMVGGNG